MGLLQYRISAILPRKVPLESDSSSQGTFTALTGAISHFSFGSLPDIPIMIMCIVFTLIFARVAALFANKAKPETLNRATGAVLVILGAAILVFNLIK